MERVIEAASEINAPIRLVGALLRNSPEVVFGESQAEALARGVRTFHSTVAVPLGSGTSVEHAIAVGVGPLKASGADGFVAELHWDPIGQERLLPSFSGELVIGPDGEHGTRLAVRGTYVAPLGPVGRFGDAVAGKRLARHSLTNYVDRIAERLSAEAAHQRQAAARKPAPYNEDLRPSTSSEHYIG